MSLWLVRAGGAGERQGYALEHGIAVVGWDNIGDLSVYSDRDVFRTAYEKIAHDAKPGKIANHVGQLWAFSKKIVVGDVVALPLKRQDAVAFGIVTRTYHYDDRATEGTRHRIGVDWKRTDVPRSQLDQDLLFSLGAFMTVCKIKRNGAEERVRAILAGKGAPLPPSNADQADDEPIEVESDHPMDFKQAAADQIRAFMSRNFTSHKLADLVSAILKAQGYQTETSDPGADGGIDIVAGRGPLGFDPPRLIVQVKGGDAQQDVKVIRELRGVMTDIGVEHGLFVAWGGFKRTVEREARERYFEIRLWDAGDVIQAVQQHYDQLPDAIRAELPLQRIWTLVPEELSE